jgi:hypothetical protein
MTASRFHCLAERSSAPASSSRRFTHNGSATVSRRPSKSRVTRCRTSVTIWLASPTRCHLSTAISASGSAARIPDAYGADGIDHHDLDHLPELFGLRRQPLPHTCPGTARSQSQQRSRPIAGAVDETGQPRIGPPPRDAVARIARARSSAERHMRSCGQRSRRVTQGRRSLPVRWPPHLPACMPGRAVAELLR